MRIVSLLPSATEIAVALGLADELTGITHECRLPDGSPVVPIVTRAVRDPGRAASNALHRLEEGWLQAGTSIYALDEDAVAEADPDLILTTRACATCAIGERAVGDLVRRLDLDATVVTLDPVSIEGVLNTIQTIGAMTEAEDAAIAVVEGLRERLRAVEEIVIGRRDHGFVPPRAAVIGWLEPPYAVGGWIPEQVRLAGGWEVLGREGGRPAGTSWDAVRDLDPEIVVLAPAGSTLPGTLAAWAAAPRPEGWAGLRAVRGQHVFAVDAAACFWRPGPGVVDGIEVMAELIDPLAFDGIAPTGSWARAG